MTFTITGWELMMAVGAVVFSMVAWAAGAIGGVYAAANIHPVWSFIFSYAFVLAVILLAMYAGSV